MPAAHKKVVFLAFDRALAGISRIDSHQGMRIKVSLEDMKKSGCVVFGYSSFDPNQII